MKTTKNLRAVGARRTQPTVQDVRTRMGGQERPRSVAAGLALFLGGVLGYGGSVVALLVVPGWPLGLVCAALAGCFLAMLLLVGHDGCHGSLTLRPWINKLLGRLAFLPCWHAYAVWEAAHNH